MYEKGTKERQQVIDFLIAFEKDIADEFNAGNIRAPVHLAGGNEEQLLDFFRQIDIENDWVCCTWRSHYHCLLKGVPPEKLKADILLGKSITLCYPEHRIISSAIAGGILPIATGLASSIQIQGQMAKVWVFVGDMVSLGGMFAECSRFSVGHNLPIKFVVEDNGKSVGTDTIGAWGHYTFPMEMGMVAGYHYDMVTYPHSGAGRRIEF